MDLGLSSQQFWVLEAIAQQGDCSLGEILAELPMDQPTASRVLAVLQERALIEVSTDAMDRRRRLLRLTARGARVAQQCTTIAKQIRNAVIAGFSERELDNLATFLERILQNLDHLDKVAPAGKASGSSKGLSRAHASAS